MRLTNNDGSPNLGQKLFTKLCVVAGAADGGEINDPVSRMIPMGKGGEEVECMVLEDFDNVPVTIRLQMEYSMYEGKIQETKSIRNFFRYEDKATASEIVNNSEEKGKQFAAEQEAGAGLFAGFAEGDRQRGRAHQRGSVAMVQAARGQEPLPHCGHLVADGDRRHHDLIARRRHR